MSHFTVLVHLTEEELTDKEFDEVLQKKLQPYHEYECTGIRDQYVFPVDKTEEELEKYNTKSVEVLFDQSGDKIGTKYCEATKRYWKRSGHGYSSDDEFVVPDGFSLIDTPLNQIYTFEKYLTDWCGHSLDGEYSDFIDGRYYDITNPNAKWDWWSIGGRWDGFFLGIDGAKHNIIKRKDWDINTVCTNTVLKFGPIFDVYEAHKEELESLVFLTWDEVVANHTNGNETDYKAAREYYHSQDFKTKLTEIYSDEIKNKFDWLISRAEDFYKVSRESFITARIHNEIGTFAVLDNAGWHEKGNMGWFACVSNENKNWGDIYLDKIRNLSDNDVLVLVDCHI